MQTERVTFLTTPDHKAALDAFAASNGMSVGHVVREATSQFIAPREEDVDERALKLLIDEVNAATPRILDSMDRLSEKLRVLHEENDAFLRQMGIRP